MQKSIYGFKKSICHLYLILINIRKCWQILMELPSAKSYCSLATEGRIDMVKITNTIFKLLIDNTLNSNVTHAHANSGISQVWEQDMV
jgi:hypothetical protein